MFVNGIHDGKTPHRASTARSLFRILANQWLVAGHYEDEAGLEKLEACVRSITGGISAIAFHDKLKGVYKDRFRALGARWGIPVMKHQGSP